MNEGILIGVPAAADAAQVRASEPEAHRRLRENAPGLLALSALLGLVYAVFFTDSSALGLNAVVFSAVWCVCAFTARRQLSLPRSADEPCRFAGILALAAAIFWSANGFIQFVSAAGIALLQWFWALELAADTRDWHFFKAVQAVPTLIVRLLARLPEPFVHLAGFRREGGGRVRDVLCGLLIAAPLAALVFVLLGSADAAFLALFDRLFGGVELPDRLWTLLRGLFFAVSAAAVFYALLCAQTARPVDGAQRPVRRASTLVAVTFCSVLAAMYAVFCLVQIITLFSGSGALLPEGYTYAGYARQGFFQLLAVSAINVLLVIVSQRRFESGRALRSVLCLISGCTVIIEISSAWRMYLYVQAYGLTFLRLTVLWFLGVLLIVLGGAVRTVFRPEFRLFRFSMAVCLAAWLVFAFSRPDALAARYDLDRFGPTDAVVDSILSQYTPDSLAELAPYLEQIRGTRNEYFLSEAMESVHRQYRDAGFRGFNGSLRRAYETAEVYFDG
ncbi:MAG: DUF4173 domain-containing protein [Oscillospiraceae bacterium]|nr:DUF4173 domain-containing protein [Oscillospiraceae bacterium]